jgi:putative nucleotidyltransferase with HDIG domain
VVSNVRNLPTPPVVFHQIQKVISDPDASAARVAGILAEDPAMSVKVLKLTNSAFYGLAREVESVKQAVVIIGMDAVKNLVLSASVLDMFKTGHVDQDFQERFWRHSLATAFCCRLLSRNIRSRGIVDSDSAFSAGLLHDVGKMVLSCFLPDEYKKFREERKQDQTSTDFQLEMRVLGYSHGHIGGFLGSEWQLPYKLCEAITHHHTPAESESGDPLIYLVHVADYISKLTFYDRDQQYLVGGISTEVAEHLEIGPEDVEHYADELRSEYPKAETFMQMVGIG